MFHDDGLQAGKNDDGAQRGIFEFSQNFMDYIVASSHIGLSVEVVDCAKSCPIWGARSK
jgi:hypothetical protein